MPVPSRWTLLGVLLTSMATLMLEIVLTRVFSVLMSYHFAFMAISLAMLGSGSAGVWLYLAARRFPPERVDRRLTLLALLYASAIVVSFILYLRIPFEFQTIGSGGLDWTSVGWLALIFLLLSLPFLLGGAVIALAISRFGQVAGQVYAWDLIGAGLGCLLSIAALSALSASGAVLLAATVAALAAVSFARRLPAGWQIVTVAGLLLGATLLLTNQAQPWLQVRTRSGYDADNRILFEKWNALSRVTVYEDPYWLQPFGWGLSTTYVGPDPGHLLLLIDANAGTPIQRWDGTPAMIDFLRYDLTSIAYAILPQADSFIIGAGGGRDILTGHLFGARSLTAVEINPAIVEAAREEFGDYAGRVYDLDNVEVAVVDARTYLSRSRRQYDLIQASLIDTWAAASSGAYSLSENGLYTREAFFDYFDRLTDRGVVSYSRWYYRADPTETLRLVALGLDSWQRAGVVDPARHVIVVANLAENRAADSGLATMLLKKTPFTREEVEALVGFSDEMAFTVLYAPGYVAPPNPVADLVNAPSLAAAIAAYPLDISVPDDNHPFFFNFVRFGDLGAAGFGANPAYRASVQGNYALLAVVGIAALLATLFIVGPLLLRRGAGPPLRRGGSYLLYYGLLGLGFMLILVPSIQKLTIYLGSPTYALTVVLFTILVGSGLGSRSARGVADAGVRRRLAGVVGVLLLVVGLHLLLLDPLTAWSQPWPLAARILLVVLVVAPAGFCMGQPFPLGLQWISRRQPTIIPWLWAINGVMSVIGSALATVLGLAFGFVVVSLAGMACYAFTLLLVRRAWKRDSVAAPSRRQTATSRRRLALPRS